MKVLVLGLTLAQIARCWDHDDCKHQKTVTKRVHVTATPCPCPPETICFDDLSPASGGSLITNGYAGLNWGKVYAINGAQVTAGTGEPGFQAGVVSSSNVAYNGNGLTGTISSISPETFTGVSVYATAASFDGDIATFNAFQGVNPAPVGTISVKLNNTHPALVVFPNTSVIHSLILLL